MTRRVLFAWAWAGVVIAAVWVCFGMGGFANGGSERLRKQVPAWFSIQSYNDAVRLIHERTGLAVSCPGELEALLKSAPVGGGLRGEPPDKEEPTREFLNQVIRCMLGLDWKFDAGKGQIELGLSWRKSDPRSPAELLQCLWKRPQAKGHDWQPTLDALLSKPENFDKAWRVRQFSRYQSVCHGVNGERFLVRRVVSETLEPSVLVMIRHHIQIYPGRGAVSYYWFTENGKLRGADLIDSGWRCDLTDGEVTPDLEQNTLPSSGPSEIRWTVTMNLSSTYTVRFRFTNQGLQWIGSTNSKGEEANLPLGNSLMPRG